MKKLLIAVLVLFAGSVIPVSAGSLGEAVPVGIHSMQDPSVANAAACGPFDATLFPGESVSKTCTLINPNPPDVGLMYTIKDIVVKDENDHTQTGTGADTFLSFFKVDVEAQQVITTGDTGTDVAHLPTFRPRCVAQDIDNVNQCKVMRIRGTNKATPLAPNERDFRITIHFLDVGNQTPYAGWYFSFTELYQVCVPATCVPSYLIPID